MVLPMTKHRFLAIILSLFLITSYSSYGNNYGNFQDIPVTTDSRIKTYIYNPNEVYLLVLHYGFQSHIEFSKGEAIETISMGDSYAWKINPLDNRLFIRPLEKNVRTNMVIITNKRMYQFDVISRGMEFDSEKDLVYQVKFIYPKKKKIK